MAATEEYGTDVEDKIVPIEDYLLENEDYKTLAYNGTQSV